MLSEFINKIKGRDYVEVTEPTSKHGVLMTTTENTLELPVVLGAAQY